MSTTRKPSFGTTPRQEDAEVIDYVLLGRYMGFALHSVGRHPFLTLSCVILVTGLAVGAIKVLPKTYRVETVIQALRNPSLPTLANAGMYRPYESDQPTRAAHETVFKRDNLIALINGTHLLERTEQDRAPVAVLRDDLARRLRGRELTHDEKMEALISSLEKSLRVDVTEVTVTLGLDWPSASLAFDVVQLASQRFLETRHTTEIAMVQDALGVLEAHAASIKHDLDDALDVEQARERASAAERRPRPQASPGTRLAEQPIRADLDFARLTSNLEAKRRAVSDLEDFRRRRLAELQAQLTQYEAMYAERHPNIISLKQSIEALSQPDPQLEALRTQVKAAELELAARGAEVPPPQELVAAPSALGQLPDARPVNPRDEYAKSRVQMLFSNYASILTRIDAARVEMAAAEAAFKYRYSIVNPPQRPKRPFKPSPGRIIGGSLVASLLIAVMASVLRDIRSRRLLEPWQLEHSLGVEILTEVER